MEDFFYFADELLIPKPNNNNFYLHNHDFYEIFMFEKGDAEHVVEENIYSLEPDDIIILRQYEMHRVYHKSDSEYKRAVLQIYPEFFDKNECKTYELPYLDSDMKGNKISAEIVRKSGIKDAFNRFRKYSQNYTDLYSPICRSTLIEILYLISGINNFLADDMHNSLVKNVIHYINNNFTENIRLDDLAKKFFVSKYHICRVFKENTGHTIHSYITRKRITRVKELRKEVSSIGEAVYLAGFGNYTSFYRAYLKEYGTSPKEMEK